MIFGFVFIAFNDRIELQLAIFIPVTVLFVYGLLLSGVLSGCINYSYVEHRIDSIYSLGFIYTLISLLVLLFKLKKIAGILPEQMVLIITLTYLAIAISTSIGGIIIRSLVMGNYLKKTLIVDGNMSRFNKASGY